jgi:hypothetical protein
MSADKNKAEGRRLKLIEDALNWESKKRIGIILNHEGGMAADNKDLREAVKRGYLRVWRGFPDGTTTYGKGHLLRPGNTPRTFAVITDLGRTYLNGKI